MGSNYIYVGPWCLAQPYHVGRTHVLPQLPRALLGATGKSRKSCGYKPKRTREWDSTTKWQKCPGAGWGSSLFQAGLNIIKRSSNQSASCSSAIVWLPGHPTLHIEAHENN